MDNVTEDLIEQEVVIEEKPKISVGLINGGFMVFNNKLLEYLSYDEKCDFEKGPLEKLANEEIAFELFKESNFIEIVKSTDIVTLIMLFLEHQDVIDRLQECFNG